MDVAAVLALVAKGLTVLDAVIAASGEVAPIMTALKNIVSTPASSITQEQMDATDKILDDQLAEFNADI